MEKTNTTSVASAVISKPLPLNDYVVVAGYLSPNGPRSASYWACREDDLMEALERCTKYCERYPRSTVKVVGIDEISLELFENLRKEIEDQGDENVDGFQL